VFPVPNAGEDGPWTVDVTMRGPDDGAYYAPFRVRLEFNAAYPMFPPEVRLVNGLTGSSAVIPRLTCHPFLVHAQPLLGPSPHTCAQTHSRSTSRALYVISSLQLHRISPTSGLSRRYVCGP
jgi:hypothetical protein